MQAIPLGKIVVANAGTPVDITLATLQAAALVAGVTLPPSLLMHKIEVWADNADTGISKVKSNSKTGNVEIAPLPVPANGNCQHWNSPCNVDPRLFAVDNTVNNNGPFVTVWVE